MPTPDLTSPIDNPVDKSADTKQVESSEVVEKIKSLIETVKDKFVSEVKVEGISSADKAVEEPTGASTGRWLGSAKPDTLLRIKAILKNTSMDSQQVERAMEQITEVLL